MSAADEIAHLLQPKDLSLKMLDLVDSLKIFEFSPL